MRLWGSLRWSSEAWGLWCGCVRREDWQGAEAVQSHLVKAGDSSLVGSRPNARECTVVGTERLLAGWRWSLVSLPFLSCAS